MRHLIRALWWRSVLASSCTLAMSSVPLEAQEDRLLPAGPAQVAPGQEVVQLYLPKFWIGIHGEPIDETLRAQLRLDHGVVVRRVMEQSPAEKAGVRVNDIVVSIAERPVHEVSDLLGPIGESDGKPVKLAIVRDGKREAIEVQPAQRPEDQANSVNGLSWAEERSRFQPWRMFFLNSPIAITSELPDDVSISITKEGKQPTKIKVKRGDDSWEVEADQMDRLPAELRPLVASLLQTPPTVRLHTHPEWGMVGQPRPHDMLMPAPQVMPFPGPPVPGVLPAPSASPMTELEPLRHEVSELKQQVESLQKAVEKLSPPNP